MLLSFLLLLYLASESFPFSLPCFEDELPMVDPALLFERDERVRVFVLDLVPVPF
jgi:hypothetical protein